MAHELPYDDPEALRRRLKIDYPIRADRADRRRRAAEHPPPAGARQPGRAECARPRPHGRALGVVLRPARDRRLHPLPRRRAARGPSFAFPRAARQMSATYDLGAAAYWALPTAPPWWAAENGYLSEPVRRLMIDVGESVWGRAWPKLYDSFNGNPWAAFPSLHFASSADGRAPPARDRAQGGRGRRRLRGGPGLRARLSRASTT